LEKFESALGLEKSKVLTELTKSFETDYLEKKYPNVNLEQKYLNFLEELAQRNFPEREEVIFEDNDKKYRSSGLMEAKYLFPDSVWIEKDGIQTKWTELNENGEPVSFEDFWPVKSNNQIVLDSILSERKKIVRFNHNGSFKNALEAVKDESDFIQLYYAYVSAAGLIGADILFNEIRDHNIDISGPVERRVIVLHFVY
jgi:hypothetical protein